MAMAAGVFAMTLVYVAGVVELNAHAVASVAWVGLYLVCLVVALPLWVRLVLSPRRWATVALYCALLALIFFGANGALDALNGAHRAKAAVAESLGGLELWFALCPGAVSVALGGAVQAWIRRSRGRAKPE